SEFSLGTIGLKARDLPWYDEAIARANHPQFASHAAIFTRDFSTALRAYARLEASAVMVNDHTAFRVDWMPFAGLKQSGLGVGGFPYTCVTCKSIIYSSERCHEDSRCSPQ